MLPKSFSWNLPDITKGKRCIGIDVFQDFFTHIWSLIYFKEIEGISK